MRGETDETNTPPTATPTHEAIREWRWGEEKVRCGLEGREIGRESQGGGVGSERVWGGGKGGGKGVGLGGGGEGRGGEREAFALRSSGKGKANDCVFCGGRSGQKRGGGRTEKHGLISVLRLLLLFFLFLFFYSLFFSPPLDAVVSFLSSSFPLLFLHSLFSLSLSLFPLLHPIPPLFCPSSVVPFLPSSCPFPSDARNLLLPLFTHTHTQPLVSNPCFELFV